MLTSSPAGLHDVFEAEGALAGEPLAFAAAAQVLPVRPFGVHVALRERARAAGPVARLQTERDTETEGGREEEADTHAHRLHVQRLTWHVMSSTRYGLKACWHFLQNCLK